MGAVVNSVSFLSLEPCKDFQKLLSLRKSIAVRSMLF